MSSELAYEDLARNEVTKHQYKYLRDEMLASRCGSSKIDTTHDLTRSLRLRVHPQVPIDPLEPQRERFEPCDPDVEYTTES